MALIHIVSGYTGEYEDRQQWMVIAFHSKRKATGYAQRATAQAKALFDTFPAIGFRPERNHRYVPDGIKLALDPNVRMDYTGTTYHVSSVHIGD